MRTLYYSVWADIITRTRRKKANVPNWKLYTIVPMSLLPGINLFTLFLWMKVLVNHNLPLVLPVDIFNNRLINGAVSMVVTFFIPFVILNYLLLFYNNHYEQVLKQYHSHDGRLYRKYVLISLGVLVIPVLIVRFYFKII